MIVAAIGAYQFLNDSFKIEDIFTSLGIFASIQNPMKSLPTTLDIILETLVSLGRIEKFLYQPEINKKNMICNDSETMKKNIAIQILNGTFTWGKKMDNTYKPVSEKQFVKIQSMEDPNKKNKKNKDEHIEMSSVSTSPNDEITNKIMKEIPNNTLFEKDIIEDKNIIEEPNDEELVLKNINLEVKKGEFICIIGEIGSGKSSLIHAILNNMICLTPRSSKIIINGKLSYVSQES
jgi:ABC-type multidrug transport system fused ATPase/permease subunit